MPFVDLKEVRLHYELSGAASRPYIVFVNSLGADLRMWDKVIPWFECDFQILRYDMRGHGLSSAPQPPYSLNQLGADLLGLLDMLDIESVTLCGLSLGGLIGQWVAIHAPARVRELILANTAARFLSQEAWQARIAFIESQGMSVLAAATPIRWFTQPYIADHPEEMKQMIAMIERTPAQGYIGCCEVLKDSDVRDSLAKINARCLIIAGTHDPATPPADGRILEAHIRAAEYVELDVSHLSAWEKPAEFARAALDFLDRNGRKDR